MLRARPSTWAFDTSRSLNISIGTWFSVSKEGGTIWLNKQKALDDAENAIPYSFDYDAVGVGVGLGQVPISFGPKSYPNGGKLFMLDAFVGSELTADDLTGICRIQEISAAVTTGLGGSATAMFLGIDPEKLAKALGMRSAILSGVLGMLLAKAVNDDDVDWTDLISTGAKALLLIAGPNVPVGTGAGISDAVGYLQMPWEDTHIEKAPDPIEIKSPEPITVSDNHTGDVEGPPIVLSGALFNTGFDTLKAEAESQLRAAKAKLGPYSGRYLVVEGYTDTVGHGSYDNQGLSERRAKRVKQWLITNAGRKDSDVIARGYGEQYPVASNNDETGRQKNRRVEIHIMQAGWRPR